MAENGLDLRTWLTVIGVFALFFGFPAATIAFDLRKARRKQADSAEPSDLVGATARQTSVAGSSRPRQGLDPWAPNTDVEAHHR
jgi:hypothetical protein